MNLVKAIAKIKDINRLDVQRGICFVFSLENANLKNRRNNELAYHLADCINDVLKIASV